MEQIKIRMLGEFSLECGTVRLSDGGNRSRKVWGLLAYLLCNRQSCISPRTLIELLWNSDSNSSNPENALRITLHRLRTMLDQLAPGAGRELILYKDNGYCWNPDVPVQLDYERFETLCMEDNLASHLEALELYGGSFLSNHSSELWVIPLSTHFHNLFLQISMDSAESLLQEQNYEQALSLCRKATSAEPYHELLHQQLIRIHAARGDQKAATEVYESLSRRLFDDFGIQPSDETKTVFRDCVHAPEGRVLPMDEVLEHLQEPPAESGAMVCDYDYFKVICYAESRSMERSGSIAHVALFSMVSPDGDPLPRRSLNRMMKQWETVLRTNLRRGDIVSRCSSSQFVIMLANANYENSNMVCRRILAAFRQAHPRAAVKANFMVQPLTPKVRVPQ